MNELTAETGGMNTAHAIRPAVTPAVAAAGGSGAEPSRLTFPENSELYHSAIFSIISPLRAVSPCPRHLNRHFRENAGVGRFAEAPARGRRIVDSYQRLSDRSVPRGGSGRPRRRRRRRALAQKARPIPKRNQRGKKGRARAQKARPWCQTASAARFSGTYRRILGFS